MFSIKNTMPLKEGSTFEPRSPYATAKYEVFNKVNSLKEKFDWNIKSGIMFNHESEFRNSSFLIMKLVEKVIDANKGNSSILELPSLAINRDWTYAKEISEAITKLMFNNLNGSYVIGSGKSYSISDIADYLFRKVNLDYRDFVKENNSIMRDGEPLKIISNPLKIKNDTGWVSKLTIFEILDKMYDYRLNRV
jgi:GDPmannose 4,6-dehydratase